MPWRGLLIKGVEDSVALDPHPEVECRERPVLELLRVLHLDLQVPVDAVIYFHKHILTTLNLTQTNRIHPSSLRLFLFFLKKQTTPILTQTAPIFTQTTLIMIHTYRLLQFSLRHTDSSPSYSDTQTHLFSQTHTDYS